MRPVQNVVHLELRKLRNKAAMRFLGLDLLRGCRRRRRLDADCVSVLQRPSRERGSGHFVSRFYLCPITESRLRHIEAPAYLGQPDIGETVALSKLAHRNSPYLFVQLLSSDDHFSHVS